MAEPPKRSRKQALKEVFFGPKDPMDRIRQADVVLKDHGFIPVFQTKTTEQRRSEVSATFSKLLAIESQIEKTANEDKKKELMLKAKLQARKLSLLFYLFFQTGSPWVRGVDNEWLSSKVSDFIEQYEDIGHIPDFLLLLHSESMQLLHMSWQGVDVTQMPDYIIQVMQPNPNIQVDMNKAFSED